MVLRLIIHLMMLWVGDMSSLLMIAIYFLFFGGMALVVRGLKIRLSGWSQTYLSIAKRYAGQVSYRFGRPRLTFRYAGAPSILISSGSRLRRTAITRLYIRWPDRRLKFFVSNISEPHGMWQTRGLQPVHVDSETPNRRITAYSNQPETARRMLSAATQWQIQQLIEHADRSGIEIVIQAGQMRVSKPGFLKQRQPLEDFVRFGLDLYDQFKLMLNNEVAFVSEDLVTVVDNAICPICSEHIQDDLVTCVRCKTPHCADCWEYNGQCATFACQETRFIRRSAALGPR